MKSKAFGFSLVGSIVIAAFMIFVNYTTSPGFPWFIFPVFAVIWWPLGVYTAQKGSSRTMAAWGSIVLIPFLISVNLITSPGFLWCVFPIYAVLWWPLSVFLGKYGKTYSVAATIMTIGFFLLVNLMTSFSHPWFIYPSFAVLWWPLALFLGRRHKAFSVISYILTVGFFLTINLVVSPGYLWFIHIAYAVLWWPLSVFLAKRKTVRLYSLIGALMTIGYLALVSYMSVAGNPWFLYTVFPLLLWPAAMYAGKYAARLPFALAGAMVGIAFYLILNIFLSPGHPWILYVLMPLVWWPVTIAFKKTAADMMFLFISVTVFMIYYGILNIFVSPGHAWSIYLLYPYAWIAVGMYFGRRKMALGLAIAGTVITALFCSIVNLILTPETIWAVFPIFAILWWPVSIYFFKTRNKQKRI